MNRQQQPRGRLWVTILFGGGAILLAASIVKSPGAAFDASLQGLTLWWRIVFPGLLPFLVISQILVAYGLVHVLGTLLDPLLRKGFGVPGVAGWVIPLGLIAGFPSAAEASAQLYAQGRLSARQAGMLASAAHFCSPMLIIVVIGTGFLHNPALGLLLAAVHSVTGLAAGMTLHVILSRRDKKRLNPPPLTSDQDRHHSRSLLQSIEEARQADGRSFGKLLGDTVASSVQTLMMIGGYMLIFAVAARMIQLYIPGFDSPLGLAGILEVHLGSYAAANAEFSSPSLQAALLGAILGFSGLSSYLQVRAVLGPAGIGTGLFLLNRMLHAIYAFGLTLFCWTPLSSLFPGAAPVYKEAAPAAASADSLNNILEWPYILSMVKWQIVILALFTASLLVFTLIWRFRGRAAR